MGYKQAAKWTTDVSHPNHINKLLRFIYRTWVLPIQVKSVKVVLSDEVYDAANVFGSRCLGAGHSGVTCASSAPASGRHGHFQVGKVFSEGRREDKKS